MTQQKMNIKKLGQAATVALALISVSTVSACSSAQEADPTPSPTTSETTPSASPTPTEAATPTQSSEPSPTSDEGGGTDDGTAPAPTGPGNLCTADQLEASLGEGDGGGAGHSYPTLILTNTGDTACETRGYPGVSFVVNGDGTQLGAAAEQDSSGAAVTQLTVAPGEAVYSQLDVVNAQNYDEDECDPQAADGFRIYPPGEKASIFVKADQFTGCANDSVELLKVQPLQPAA
ncbi:MAG: DUF4232 domain-containing protein [Ancrocorticia sp.]|uniref:DUF4232 domain-containing protein n=2 Tax=Ancrocorticia sp. TaxID=2593684 RepID=UPI003F930C96